MSDIFISYAREDKERAAVLAKALEKNGWSVWWDRKIPPGKTFSSVIEEAIEAAKCVIVLWSKDSTASDWVQNEASEGARKKTLVPALIDDVQIPFEFRRIQAADLIDWQAQPDHPGFANLINAVSQFAGPPAAVEKTSKPKQKPAPKVATHIETDTKATEKPKRRKMKFIIACSLLTCIVVIAGIWYASINAEKKARTKVRRDFSALTSKMKSLVEDTKDARTLQDLNKLNNTMNNTYKRMQKKLTQQAKELNLNVSATLRTISKIESQWKKAYQEKLKQLSPTLSPTPLRPLVNPT